MLDSKWINKVHQGHALDLLKQLPSESVDCIVTSPPYWSLESFIYEYGGIIVMKRDKQGRFIKGEHYNRSTEFKKGRKIRYFR